MHLPDFIDHTHLKPTATLSEIQQLCEEAKRFGFHAVCVNGCHVSLASEELKNTKVKIAAVVGFPLGAMSTEAKILEAKDCVEHGADEIDMVINIGWLKSNEVNRIRNEIISIKRGIGDKILKVILETCYLTTSEKEKACILAVEAGADFVKTSTGFGSGGATFEDVILMKRMVGDKAKIKASGGIKDKETALKYIALGVYRIGTSSGPALLN